jgi:hypothetical protein
MRRNHWLLTAFMVAGILASGCSGSDDNSANIHEDLTSPAAPLNLSAQVSGASITLEWTANTEVDLDTYYIYRSWNQGAWEFIGARSAPPFVDQAPPKTPSHFAYRASALDDSGNESALSETLQLSFDPANTEPYVSNRDQ